MSENNSNLYDYYEGEDEEKEESVEELPPEAKEYYEYKNQIDIMEKEKKLLEENLKEAKRNDKMKKLYQKTKNKPFEKYEYSDYKQYEKKILNNMIDEDLFDDVGTSKDILGSFVDRVLNRSLYLYKNRNCHTCSKLLSMGMSTQKCPKCHHLLRELNNQRKKYKKNIKK